MINVKDFGAAGNGVANDTAAIQAAIDAGGIVHFPAGTYLTGTIYLRSNGGLDLEQGAVLLGSPDPADYNGPHDWPQNADCIPEKAYGAHLIVVLEQENVLIRGGIIDGNRAAFFDPGACSRDDFTGWRPSQMVYICESKGIRLENTHLKNSPYWACYIFGCTDVFVSGLLIRQEERKAWNGDGLDIDCSSNVVVSDSIIISADDSLTVRASSVKRLLHKEGVCENVTVTNCVLSSREAAIRLGVGSGIIRNCVFSNCTIYNTHRGIVLLSTYLPDEFPNGAKGVDISNVLFENMTINAIYAFDVCSNWALHPLKNSQQKIHGVTFRNIRAESRKNSIVQGNLDHNVYDVAFENIMLNQTEKAGTREVLYAKEDVIHDPRLWDDSAMDYSWGERSFMRPCVFYIAHADDVRFEHCRIRWDRNIRPGWLCDFMLKDNQDFRLEQCDFHLPENSMLSMDV